jgi:hypothetical protein
VAQTRGQTDHVLIVERKKRGRRKIAVSDVSIGSPKQAKELEEFVFVRSVTRKRLPYKEIIL